MRVVKPKFAWEIPVNSDALIAAALARARPAALAGAERRLDGMPDETVTQRYRELRALVLERAGANADVSRRLQRLEEREADASWTLWQTSLMLIDADDDPAVIEAARTVWETLGPNAYGLEFKARPRTYSGSLEGRNWLTVTALGWVGCAVAAAEVDQRYGIPWWLVGLPAIAGWTYGIWRLFIARYRARERVAGRQLPHF